MKLWRSAIICAAVAVLFTTTAATSGMGAARAAPPTATTPAIASVAIGTAAAAGQPSSVSPTPRSSWWGTNGRVTDIVRVGSQVYLSGAFDYIGPQTGYGVTVTSTTASRKAFAPVVDGIVRAAVADGHGGFYLAGDFTHVGATYRRGAAQIDARGAVTGWNPRPKGSVTSLAVAGDLVVLAGDISAVGSAGSPVSRIVAVDRRRGARVSGWDASPNATVRSLVATDSALYLGGDFTSVAGASASHLARLSPTTGALDTSFAASTTGPVRALTMSGDNSILYAGGEFGSAGSQTRANLAAFATTNGALTAWAPATNGTVMGLTAEPKTGMVYVGGAFTTASGLSRIALVEVSPAGSVTGFDARLNGCNAPHTTKNTNTMVACQPEVDVVQVRAGVLYVGGRFGRAGAMERHNALGVRLARGSITPWNPVASGRVLAIAPEGSTSFVGGDLTSVGGLVRSGLAALHTRTGAGVRAFRADTDNIALDLEPSPDGRRLYVTGSFTTVAGRHRDRIAALSLPSGRLDPTFRAQANQTAIVAKATGSSLFVAGIFTEVNDRPRRHLVKLSGTTGAVDGSFTADTTGPSGPLRRGGMVQGLAVRSDGSRVYAAGPFTSVGGVPVTGGIAVLDGRTGALTPKQLGGVASACPNIGDQWITHLYLNPSQTGLYGGDTCPDNIYRWDAVALGTTSNPTGLTWQTWCNAGFQAGLEVRGRFYYGSHGGDRGRGGYCWQSPSQFDWVARQRLVEFDAATGSLSPNSYTFNSPMGVWALAEVPGGLLVGGDFSQAGGTTAPRQGLALLPGAP